MRSEVKSNSARADPEHERPGPTVIPQN